MKSIFLNIKNLVPYLLLISIYFFFVNLEAKNDNKFNNLIELEKNKKLNESNINNVNSSIIIPVIQYKD